MLLQAFLSFALLFGAPPALASFCDDSSPAIKDANTVTLSIYADGVCCVAPVQTTTMGTLGRCHSAVIPVYGFKQAVGDNMFGRGIKVLVFETTVCTGKPRVFSLTNSGVCDETVGGEGWQFNSFMINNTVVRLYSSRRTAIMLTCCSLERSNRRTEMSACHPVDMPKLQRKWRFLNSTTLQYYIMYSKDN